MSSYAVDFDGTLCTNLYPKIGQPNQDVIDKLIKLKDEDNKLILWTCRTGEELNEAIEWCEEKGLAFDSVNENLEEVKESYEEDSRKIVADYYLDDKALTIDDFLGEEVENMSKVLQFKNKDSKTGRLKNTGRMEIKNQTEEKAELYFYGDIVSNSWQSYWYDEDKCPQDISDFLKELDNSKAIDIYINSGGGSVHGGLAIYNMLKRHKGEKIVYIDGIAASIASVIAMAGDKVIIPTNAQFMIHKPLSWGDGNADDFRKLADILDTCQKSITSIYMDNVVEGITEEEITRLINEETWFTGEEAAKYFNIEVQEQSEIVASSSDYFDKYKNTPELLKEDNEPVNSDDIADKVIKVIEAKKKQEDQEAQNKLEEEKIAILEDLDLI